MKKKMNSKLVEFRHEQHLSQEKFACIIGYSQSHYSQIENGTRMPGVAFFIALGKHFDISLELIWELMNFGR